MNVISKSGKTTEPAVAFRLFRDLLERRYGEDGARERIFVTTDRARGKLLELAREKGYQTFVVPDDVGGRYSVLTPVGLLPIAVAGIDIDAMLDGAAKAREDALSPDSDAVKYAAIRNLLLRSGKSIEILATYESRMAMIAEWWKQLYGESEGKDGKGLFPASVIFLPTFIRSANTSSRALATYLKPCCILKTRTRPYPGRSRRRRRPELP